MEDLAPQMLPTLKKLSLHDVMRIWDTVSEYIQQMLLMNQGIKIPGFGTFLIIEQQILDVGYSVITVWRPVFQISDTLVDFCGFISTQDHISDNRAIAELNYLWIATETDFPLRTVKGCVKEIAFSFCSCLAKRHNAKLVFRDLGILVVQGKELQMRFYQKFLKSLDWTGKLLQAFLRDPETKDLVISGKEATPSWRHSTLLFVFPQYAHELARRNPKAQLIPEFLKSSQPKAMEKEDRMATTITREQLDHFACKERQREQGSLPGQFPFYWQKLPPIPPSDVEEKETKEEKVKKDDYFFQRKIPPIASVTVETRDKGKQSECVYRFPLPCSGSSSQQKTPCSRPQTAHSVCGGRVRTGQTHDVD